jgi:predicted nucleic acid-binding protein
MTSAISIYDYDPKGGEKYFVDTNVWYWFTYVASKEMQLPDIAKRYQIEGYPLFVEKALEAGARLFHSPLSMAELSHRIEGTELQLYEMYNHKTKVNRKRFRGNPKEREGVIKEIANAWSTVESISECLDAKLDSSTGSIVLGTMKNTLLDSYDALFIDHLKKAGIDRIITDDGDFISQSDAMVYTANRRMIGG